ncbi:MAG: GNAT family N-acetyltransferase [Anaerolineae bacterium]|nr:MAG: GNAT family N-acetyltransferase [Anaerolineae bacterium]
MLGSDKSPITIRLAAASDAEQLAPLCDQLGYPSTPQEVAARMERILGDERHAVFVAADRKGNLIGWVHVYLRPLLEEDLSAEVGGMVVEESYRLHGAGRLLMQHAEDWARQRGCRYVTVRSNIIRTAAHQFYERLGYVRIKTQLAFRKFL